MMNGAWIAKGPGAAPWNNETVRALGRGSPDQVALLGPRGSCTGDRTEQRWRGARELWEGGSSGGCIGFLARR